MSNKPLIPLTIKIGDHYFDGLCNDADIKIILTDRLMNLFDELDASPDIEINGLPLKFHSLFMGINYLDHSIFRVANIQVSLNGQCDVVDVVEWLSNQSPENKS